MSILPYPWRKIGELYESWSVAIVFGFLASQRSAASKKPNPADVLAVFYPLDPQRGLTVIVPYRMSLSSRSTTRFAQAQRLGAVTRRDGIILVVHSGIVLVTSVIAGSPEANDRCRAAAMARKRRSR